MTTCLEKKVTAGIVSTGVLVGGLMYGCATMKTDEAQPPKSSYSTEEKKYGCYPDADVLQERKDFINNGKWEARELYKLQQRLKTK